MKTTLMTIEPRGKPGTRSKNPAAYDAFGRKHKLGKWAKEKDND